MKRTRNKYPKGWTETRVRQVLAHYESQTDREAAAEDDQRVASAPKTVMRVPGPLVNKVRALIAKHQTSARRRKSA